MIKNIIFDLGGVLLNLNMPRCFANFEALGADKSYFMGSGSQRDTTKGATICDGIRASGDMDLYQAGRISTEDFLTNVRTICKSGTTEKDVLDAWNSCLLDIPGYKLDLLKALRGKGYRVFMLSNTNDAHWKRIEKVNFPEPVGVYFDDVYLSHELGMAKPNADIYEEVLRRICAPADECLFIDDAQVNCDAAARLGIKVQKYDVGTKLEVNI